MAASEEVLNKLKHFCAYQERSHEQVRQKLRKLKVWGEDAELIIMELIQEDFLNEERYARAYARGKFRMKQWGKYKIKGALKRDKVSAYCIKKAMQEIDEDDYKETLRSLAVKKYDSVAAESPLEKQYKTQRYLVGKGYEFSLINEILTEIRKER